MPLNSDFCQMTYDELEISIISPFDKDEREIFVDSSVTKTNQAVSMTSSYAPALDLSYKNGISLVTSSTNTLVINAIQASSVLASMPGATKVSLDTLGGVIQVTASEANKLDLGSPTYNKLIVNDQQFNLESDTASGNTLIVEPSGTQIK